MPKIDKWFQHEGLDRTHTILVMLEELLGHPAEPPVDDVWAVHPAIWNDECELLLRKVTDNLAELYQKIGEWEEVEDTDGK